MTESSIEKTGFQWNKPTAMMLGRYQPWHEGHTALFKECLAKVGQVAVLVRGTEGIDDKNPLSWTDVQTRIYQALKEYEGKYIVLLVPNITNIMYGRDVGYSIEKIDLPSEIEAISATEIRRQLGL